MSGTWFAKQILLARRGSMLLIEGFRELDRATPMQRRRMSRIFAGRALQAKQAGRHNTAHAWLENAGRIV